MTQRGAHAAPSATNERLGLSMDTQQTATDRGIGIAYRSTDGRTVLVEFGRYSLTTAQALAFASDLQRAASWAENVDSRHERHVNLMASCPLCRYEAGEQTDRLTWDEEDEA